MSDVRRVCLLGAESTGKTTMAASLSEAYDAPWNPEYGRVYTEVGRTPGADWESWEFTHIARVHCWYEDFLAERADRLLFTDTDAFTTAVFHELYLHRPAEGFDELAARVYDLYLVCGLDVPWEHDGYREFEEGRAWMHGQLLARARESGSPWVLLDGPHEERLVAARAAVDALLSGDS